MGRHTTLTIRTEPIIGGDIARHRDSIFRNRVAIVRCDWTVILDTHRDRLRRTVCHAVIDHKAKGNVQRIFYRRTRMINRTAKCHCVIRLKTVRHASICTHRTCGDANDFLATRPTHDHTVRAHIPHDRHTTRGEGATRLRELNRKGSAIHIRELNAIRHRHGCRIGRVRSTIVIGNTTLQPFFRHRRTQGTELNIHLRRVIFTRDRDRQGRRVSITVCVRDRVRIGIG